MPRISIIIPIYNAEHTIRKCLSSIKGQTFDDFEVILINDGSDDNSVAECENIIIDDNRFKLFHESNSGVSRARNLGLQHARGDFILFVDADDWLEQDALEVLISRSDNVDIVISNCFLEYGNDIQAIGKVSYEGIRKANIHSLPLGILIPEAVKYYDGVEVSFLGAGCAKLIRRSIIETNNIRFNEKLKRGEDSLFILECYLNATDIYITVAVTYHYLITGSSSSHRYRPNVHEENNLEFYNSFMRLYPRLDSDLEVDYKDFLAYRCYLSLISSYIMNKENQVSLTKKYHLLKAYINNNVIYNIYGKVPKYLPIFKRVELISLKKKLFVILILCQHLRELVKK